MNDASFPHAFGTMLLCLECSLVVEYWPGMYEVLGLDPSTAKKQTLPCSYGPRKLTLWRNKIQVSSLPSPLVFIESPGIYLYSLGI